MGNTGGQTRVQLWRHRTFTKTVLTILSFVLALTIIFLCVFYSAMLRTMENNLNTSNQAVLDKTVFIADTVMAMTKESIDSICWNEAVVAAVINPAASSSQRSFDTNEALQEFVNSTPYLVSAALIANYDGSVYSTRNLPADLSGAGLDDLLASPSLCTLKAGELELVRSGEGSLYLRCRFIPGYRGYLGTFLFKINESLFVESICGTSDSIYMTSPELSPIFSATVPLGEELAHSVAQSPAGGLYKGPGTVTLWKASDYSGVCFFFPYSVGKFSVADCFRWQEVSTTLTIIIPVLLILSFAAAWILYRPMRDAMLRIRRYRDPEMQQSADDWATLTSVIEKLEDQNILSARLISGASNEILSKLFNDLLSGIPFTADEIDQMLLGLHSPLCEQGNYLLYTVQNRITGIFPREELEKVIENIQNFSYQKCSFVPFFNQFSLLVLVRLDEASMRFFDTASEEIEKALQIYSAALPDAAISHSKLFHHLQQMPAAAQQAAEGLRAQEISASDSLSLEEIIAQSIRSIPQQSEEAAVIILQKLLSKMPLPTGACPECWDTLQQELLSLAAQYGTTAPNITDKNGQALQGKNAGEYIRYVSEQTGKMIHTIFQKLDKRSNRYLTLATQYIEENYMDSGLSLNGVAERVGISPSYLSKMFTDAYNVRFMQYVNRMRVENAKRLLQDDSILIRDISVQTGFLTIQNFMRTFKLQTGLTPSEYRSLPRKQQ